jgi:hypothetical protein
VKETCAAATHFRGAGCSGVMLKVLCRGDFAESLLIGKLKGPMIRATPSGSFRISALAGANTARVEG